MTFALPNSTSPGSLEITLWDFRETTVPKLECMGASCQLVVTPQVVQHIAWRAAAAR
jgi:hypothetical protein